MRSFSIHNLNGSLYLFKRFFFKLSINSGTSNIYLVVCRVVEIVKKNKTFELKIQFTGKRKENLFLF